MRKTGREHFSDAGVDLDFSVGNFWAWNQSNLLENRNRGVLAEYIVAKSLNALAQDSLRVEWDDWDLITYDGIKVEVKSAAYIQSWTQKADSKISFSVAPKRSLEGSLVRNADVYIFCLLHHRDRDTIDPLRLEQWTFYVVSEVQLTNMVHFQKTISLSKLLEL